MIDPRKMPFWHGSVAELLTMTAALVALPFYLGFVHTSAPLFALYAGVAGTAMAAGEFFEHSDVQHGGIRLLAAVAAVWATIVGIFGSFAYFVAYLV